MALTSELASLRWTERNEIFHIVIGKRLQNASSNQTALRIAQQMNTIGMSITYCHQIGAHFVNLMPDILQARPSRESVRIVNDRSGMMLQSRKGKMGLKTKMVCCTFIVVITRLISSSINSILGAPVIIPCINTTYRNEYIGFMSGMTWNEQKKNNIMRYALVCRLRSAFYYCLILISAMSTRVTLAFCSLIRQFGNCEREWK